LKCQSRKEPRGRFLGELVFQEGPIAAHVGARRSAIGGKFSGVPLLVLRCIEFSSPCDCVEHRVHLGPKYFPFAERVSSYLQADLDHVGLVVRNDRLLKGQGYMRSSAFRFHPRTRWSRSPAPWIRCNWPAKLIPLEYCLFNCT